MRTIMIKRIFENDFEQIFEIMENSFPLEEFRTKEEQFSLFLNKNYKIYGYLEEDKLLSFAAIWELDDITFIEHLATNPKHRGRGIGKEILLKIIAESNGIVCLEVEPPIDNITRRRISFYERCGMHMNDYPYMQPSISEGRDPVPLFIMTSKGKIDKEKFLNIQNILYKEVYRTE